MKRKAEVGDSAAAKKPRSETVAHASYSERAVSGQVLTLGEGDTGQLGLGPDVLDRTKPALVAAVGDNVAQVSAGGMHTVCVDNDGQVVTFGCNDEGALGRDTTEEDSETVPGQVAVPGRVVFVSAGDSHTAALTEGGKLYIWGTFRDANGGIGLTPAGVIEKEPILVESEKRVVKMASGCDHIAFLTESGDVFTFGNSEQGQLGRVAECFSYRGGRKGVGLLLTPGPVHFKRRRARFADVCAGQYVTFALQDNGTVWAWGLNNYSHLGFDDQATRFMPQRVTSFDPSLKWSAIEGGQHHTLALDGQGRVHSLGRKEYGRLGLGAPLVERSAPTLLPALSHTRCTGVSCGTTTSFAVSEAGELYGWGMGESNQLARKDDDDDVLEPALMEGKQLEGRRVVHVSAGGQHLVILATVKDDPDQ